ncbi:hypothetical protein RU94_GL002118 [Enterococcus asini]|nr:hypothetical protein RU94_GL002118 [Enterococcus asini]
MTQGFFVAFFLGIFLRGVRNNQFLLRGLTADLRKSSG